MLMHDRVETLREKFYRLGVAGLSPAEVLALCLGDDTTGRAWQLLNGGHLVTLMRNRLVGELARVVGEDEAIRLAAAVEVGRRCYEPGNGDICLDHVEAVQTYIMQHIGMSAKENFIVIMLNTRNIPVGHEIVYIGQVGAIHVRMAEIFRTPTAWCVPRIVVGHNHPSGDPTPSPEDVRITAEILKAGKLLGINVLDHVIVGGKRAVSLYRDYQYLWNNQ